MPVFHGYEIYTDGSVVLRVDLTPEDNKCRFDKDVAALGDEDYSYRIGTVEADDPEQAMDKVRAGQWDYTEVL